jgi:DNA-binding transcriptional regulator YbjK
MMWKLRKYHTPNAHQEIRWRARQPVKGKKFDMFGNLKWDDARSADLYAYDRKTSKQYSDHWSDLYDTHTTLKGVHESLEFNYSILKHNNEHTLSIYRELYNRVYNTQVTNRWSRILQKLIDYLFILKARVNNG